MPTYVRLEYAAQQQRSQDYGPYAYVHITYHVLRGMDDDHQEAAIATMTGSGRWICHLDGRSYSDVVIFEKES